MDTGMLRLEDVGRGDIVKAVGKGANLGEMAGKGFPVPPGFIVPAQVCEGFLRKIGYYDRLRMN
jgi:pyruvate,water dikinase